MIFGGNVIKAIRNQSYTDSLLHLISVATLPCVIKHYVCALIVTYTTAENNKKVGHLARSSFGCQQQ